ncbi:MAG: ATP-binding protein [bacterium]
MTLSIGKKLISGTIAMLVLVVVMSLVSIWSVRRVGKGGDIILKASSYICEIQNLRLSFEKVLMPPHDYLIYGDPKEIRNLEQNLRELKQALVKVQEMVKEYEGDHIDAVERPLDVTSDGIVTIDALARELFAIPDPLRIKAGGLMKEMDALTEQVRERLEGLIHSVAHQGNSRILQPAYEIMITFQHILMPPHDYLITGNVIERENYQGLRKRLEEEKNRLLDLSGQGREREQIRAVFAEFKGVTSLAEQILAIDDPIKFEASKTMKRMDSISDHIILELDGLLEHFRSEGENAKGRADRITAASIHFAILASLILIIGGLIAGLAFSSSITDPVRQLLQATQRISAGDFSHKAQVESTDEIGALAQSFNTMTDHLKTYQERLIHAKEYIDNIIKSMIDTLIVVDPDGTIRTVNQATLNLLNYEREEDLIGKPVETILANAVSLFRGEEMDRLITEGSIRNYNAVYKTRDGIEIPINLSASVMSDKDGILLGTVGVARDMREIQNLINNLTRAYKDLQNTQAQLIQSSRLASMGVLAAGIAHEINNPMNTIINYAGLLEDELDPNSEHASYIQGILNEAQRIINIVQNLLAFARTDKKDHTPCHITDIITTSVTFMEAYLAKDGIAVTTYFEPDLPLIKGKASQLEQVFINLILNARDALNERYPARDSNKRIEIQVRKGEEDGGDHLHIEFRDFGTGIDEEDLDKIFDPFFTTKRADKGTGLGLSISYGIIRDHKGRVKVRSEKGRHTTFIIDLPTEDGLSKLEEYDAQHSDHR